MRRFPSFYILQPALLEKKTDPSPNSSEERPHQRDGAARTGSSWGPHGWEGWAGPRYRSRWRDHTDVQTADTVGDRSHQEGQAPSSRQGGEPWEGVGDNEGRRRTPGGRASQCSHPALTHPPSKQFLKNFQKDVLPLMTTRTNQRTLC